MELTIISEEANRAKLSIFMGKYAEEMGSSPVEPKMLSVGGLSLTFRIQTKRNRNSNTTLYILSLKLSTDNKNESEMYVCFLNSKFFYMNNSCYFCDDSNWRHLYESEGNVKIDLTVESKVVPIQSPFAVLYEDTELTDFELRGEDGSSVQVHSFVLAASSPVLRAMLGKQCKETKDRSYHIKDATQTTLQHLKDFMYTKAIPETGVEELLQLSHCYMMPELEKGCTKQLLDNLKADNVMALTEFAFTHELIKFRVDLLRRIESGTVKFQDMKIE